MTKKELYEMTFEEAIEQLMEENNNITTYETLKHFAIEQINNGNYFLAIHVLEVLDENDEPNYYNYDYSMGTLETPTPIETLEDLEDFCEEE